MASPTSQQRLTTSTTTAATSIAVNKAFTAMTAGDTIIVAMRCAVANTSTWPAGWDNFLTHDTSPDAADDTEIIIWRKADGTETSGTITVNFSASTKAAAVAYRITGAADPTVTAPDISTETHANSVNPDPGSVTVTSGPRDILAIAFDTHAGEQTTTVTYPTSYVNTGQITTGSASATTTNAQVNFCDRQLTAVSSEDPSAFTISGANEWVAYTVAVGATDPNATVIPSTIAVAAAVPGPTILAAAIVTTSVVATTASVPAPTLVSDQVITSATITCTASVPGPTLLATALTAPTTVAVLADAPAPTLLAAAITQPTTVAVTVALPAPTIIVGGGGDATPTPATIAAISAILAPTISGTALITPATIAMMANVPAPTVISGDVGSPVDGPTEAAALASPVRSVLIGAAHNSVQEI